MKTLTMIFSGLIDISWLRMNQFHLFCRCFLQSFNNSSRKLWRRLILSYAYSTWTLIFVYYFALQKSSVIIDTGKEYLIVLTFFDIILFSVEKIVSLFPLKGQLLTFLLHLNEAPPPRLPWYTWLPMKWSTILAQTNNWLTLSTTFY